jgi:deoxyadenosine/deoxycytidine kinase
MKIVIDGHIGSGKSTQLDMLRHIGFNVITEPIEKWPLELFYSDPERWGLLFQLTILQTLKTEDGFRIYERCPLSSRDVFWKTMKKTELENKVYLAEFDFHAWRPDVYIYISKDPELCHEHIQTRSQRGDSGVSLEYLQSLDKCYTDMFENMKDGIVKFKVDGNKPIDDIHREIIDIIRVYHLNYIINGTKSLCVGKK